MWQKESASVIHHRLVEKSWRITIVVWITTFSFPAVVGKWCARQWTLLILRKLSPQSRNGIWVIRTIRILRFYSAQSVIRQQCMDRAQELLAWSRGMRAFQIQWMFWQVKQRNCTVILHGKKTIWKMREILMFLTMWQSHPDMWSIREKR